MYSAYYETSSSVDSSTSNPYSWIIMCSIYFFVIAIFIAIPIIISSITYSNKMHLGMNSFKRRSIAASVIIQLLTGNIYSGYWIGCLESDIQILDGKSKKSIAPMVCYFIVPFYSWYWVYSRAKALNRISVSRGVPTSASSVLCLILNIFGLGIISCALLQNDLNNIADRTYNPGGGNPYNREQDLNKRYEENIDKLEQLFALKQKGIITEEEFETKKKQILGL